MLSRGYVIALPVEDVVRHPGVSDHRPAIIVPSGGIEVTGRNIPVVLHSAEKNLRSAGKAPGIGIASIVPLPDSVALVALGAAVVARDRVRKQKG